MGIEGRASPEPANDTDEDDSDHMDREVDMDDEDSQDGEDDIEEDKE